eukprot:NODE_289_length_10645_cov_0.615115.p8 type:complete len:168 gc:universal NODE_289_length_10645_cov_0.615115:7375-7878(+)
MIPGAICTMKIFIYLIHKRRVCILSKWKQQLLLLQPRNLPTKQPSKRPNHPVVYYTYLGDSINIGVPVSLTILITVFAGFIIVITFFCFFILRWNARKEMVIALKSLHKQEKEEHEKQVEEGKKKESLNHTLGGNTFEGDNRIAILDDGPVLDTDDKRKPIDEENDD